MCRSIGLNTSTWSLRRSSVPHTSISCVLHIFKYTKRESTKSLLCLSVALCPHVHSPKPEPNLEGWFSRIRRSGTFYPHPEMFNPRLVTSNTCSVHEFHSCRRLPLFLTIKSILVAPADRHEWHYLGAPSHLLYKYK